MPKCDPKHTRTHTHTRHCSHDTCPHEPVPWSAHTLYLQKATFFPTGPCAVLSCQRSPGAAREGRDRSATVLEPLFWMLRAAGGFQKNGTHTYTHTHHWGFKAVKQRFVYPLGTVNHGTSHTLTFWLCCTGCHPDPQSWCRMLSKRLSILSDTTSETAKSPKHTYSISCTWPCAFTRLTNHSIIIILGVWGCYAWPWGCHGAVNR